MDGISTNVLIDRDNIMAERSFAQEVQKLKLGDGDIFRGEGILAVTKALLQSGVSYVGGYQGSPVSHLIDVMNDAQEILTDLGVHFEATGSEATAAAMLSASINYPLRGAVTWKSTVGTNVASDALSNLASAGVVGGVVIILGEDYGEGASIMQERTHAFAMKSQMWLLDPRPNLTSMTQMIETGFELSEASNTPVMFMMRIRACHVTGEFSAKNNKASRYSANNPLPKPIRDIEKIILPPVIFNQEKQKIEQRWPAAVDYIKKNKLNEFFDGTANDIGIILQGGLYNITIRALQNLGLSDAMGNSPLPLYILNVTYPLIPDEVVAFCAGKREVILLEEGQPEFIEQSLHSILRKADLQTKLHGKGMLPMAGEYTGQVVLEGLATFLETAKPNGLDLEAIHNAFRTHKVVTTPNIDKALATHVPARPAGLCTGCPERPLFSAIKQLQEDLGEFHISTDIGCNSFATLPPFNMGNTIMGYGLSLASSSAVRTALPHRAISIMGDGAFWHNGLTSGVASAVFNHHDGVLIIVNNGYSAATGGQDIPSWVKPSNIIASTVDVENINRLDEQPIAEAVRGMGAKWVRTITTYDIEKMRETLREAMSTDYQGLKVIIAEGECALNKQRRIKPVLKKQIAEGKRTVKHRFVVDSETCTGDHACIRLSGCPSLTIKPNPDPLRVDPVAYVDNSCIGCGVCGGNAHSAILCPSFSRAEVIYNPNWMDKLLGEIRRSVIGFLQQRMLRQQEKYSL
jgi:indolepyruvate ferredoxin oxidoreductase, alpha subunit